ncbi:MAG: hypothetical protein ACK481_04460 [Candidatus Melainabacteria bacterium]
MIDQNIKEKIRGLLIDALASNTKETLMIRKARDSVNESGESQIRDLVSAKVDLFIEEFEQNILSNKVKQIILQDLIPSISSKTKAQQIIEIGMSVNTLVLGVLLTLWSLRQKDLFIIACCLLVILEFILRILWLYSKNSNRQEFN